MDLAAFVADDLTLDAVSRCFGIIGEAATHIPKEVIAAHPEIPWAEMRAMRNVVVQLRRECLDHIVVLGEIHLTRILAGYFEYYYRSRCRLSLVGDAPEPRPAQGPELGRVESFPKSAGCIIDTSAPPLDAPVV